MTQTSEWESLDSAARANLQGSALTEFFRYRDELCKGGHRWPDDAEEILTGYLWDESEE